MGSYLIENNTTIRNVAKKFSISKSTVHKDITQNLKKVNPELYTKVKEILEINKKERHLRGGEATKRKFMREKIKH
jgi:putative DeoR family transcriptional regulator (stage III sporulation protein D)